MLDIRSAAHIHEGDPELYLHLLERDTRRELLSVCLGHQIVLHRLQGKSESPQKRSEPRFCAEGEAILLGILRPKAILSGTVVQSVCGDGFRLGLRCTMKIERANNPEWRPHPQCPTPNTRFMPATTI